MTARDHWRRVATDMLAAHGLIERGWRFEYNRRKRAVGLCSYRDRTIYLSEHFLGSPDSELHNTLLHEVAHALVGPGHGHDRVWRAQARALGCTGDRCASDAAQCSATPTYRIVCTNGCGTLATRYRVTAATTRNRVCGRCRSPIAVEVA